MRTIIHIGQHKTGTTSLQHYLKKHREELLDQGLYVPNSLAGIDHPSHYLLNVYALDKERLSPMKETLLNTKSTTFFSKLEDSITIDIERHYKKAKEKNCSDIIWTNEGLYLLNSVKEYKRLLKLFEKYTSKVTCICTFREKQSFRKSYKQQLIKQGIPFCKTGDSYRNTEPDSWLFNYNDKRELLSKSFKDNIFLKYNPNDMTSIIMSKLGYKPEKSKEKRLNTSPYKL